MEPRESRASRSARDSTRCWIASALGIFPISSRTCQHVKRAALDGFASRREEVDVGGIMLLTNFLRLCFHIGVWDGLGCGVYGGRGRAGGGGGVGFRVIGVVANVNNCLRHECLGLGFRSFAAEFISSPTTKKVRVRSGFVSLGLSLQGLG